MSQLNSINYQTLDNAQAVNAPSNNGMQTMEEAVGVNMLGDLDSQISKIGNDMRESLGKKKEIRAEMDVARKISDKPLAEGSTPETPLIKISADELAQLGKLGINTTDFKVQPDGSYIGPQKTVTSFIEGKKEEMAQLNSESEITYLTLQGLMDERKTAFTMLSNLMSAEHETTAAIIRNFKS